MDPHDLIKTHLGRSVPYATHTGVEIIAVGDGVGRARLELGPASEKRFNGQHAGTMITLGEAASGAAVAEALAPVILQMLPVAEIAEITHRKCAHGMLIATARTSCGADELMAMIARDGRVAFDVVVDIRDAEEETVVEMKVNWFVRSVPG